MICNIEVQHKSVNPLLVTIHSFYYISDDWWIFLGSDDASDAQFCGETVFRSSQTILFSCWRGSAPPSPLKYPERSSIGFKTGDILGWVTVFVLFPSLNSCVIFLVRLTLSSCWRFPLLPVQPPHTGSQLFTQRLGLQTCIHGTICKQHPPYTFRYLHASTSVFHGRRNAVTGVILGRSTP